VVVPSLVTGSRAASSLREKKAIRIVIPKDAAPQLKIGRDAIDSALKQKGFAASVDTGSSQARTEIALDIEDRGTNGKAQSFEISSVSANRVLVRGSDPTGTGMGLSRWPIRCPYGGTPRQRPPYRASVTDNYEKPAISLKTVEPKPGINRAKINVHIEAKSTLDFVHAYYKPMPASYAWTAVDKLRYFASNCGVTPHTLSRQSTPRETGASYPNFLE
jgi:hypothetical protein